MKCKDLEAGVDGRIVLEAHQTCLTSHLLPSKIHPQPLHHVLLERVKKRHERHVHLEQNAKDTLLPTDHTHARTQNTHTHKGGG
jgi:hypothetical protein